MYNSKIILIVLNYHKMDSYSSSKTYQKCQICSFQIQQKYKKFQNIFIFMIVRSNSIQEANQNFYLSLFPIKLLLSRQEVQKGNYPDGSLSFALFQGKRQIDTSERQIPCDFDTDGQMLLTQTSGLNSIISTFTLTHSRVYILKIYLINHWFHKSEIGKATINIRKIVCDFENENKSIDYTLDSISQILKLQYQICIGRSPQQLQQIISMMKSNQNMAALTRTIGFPQQNKIKKLRSLALQTIGSENQNSIRNSSNGRLSFLREEASIKEEMEDMDLQFDQIIQKSKSMNPKLNSNPEQLVNLNKWLPKKISRDQSHSPQLRVSKARSQYNRNITLRDSRSLLKQKQKIKKQKQNQSQKYQNMILKAILLAILLTLVYKLMSPTKRYSSRRRF